MFGGHLAQTAISVATDGHAPLRSLMDELLRARRVKGKGFLPLKGALIGVARPRFGPACRIRERLPLQRTQADFQPGYALIPYASRSRPEAYLCNKLAIDGRLVS